MRVGLVAERMLTGFGVDLCVDQLASGLTQRGHEVTVYCSRADSTYKDRDYGIQVIPVPGSDFMPKMDRSGRRWAKLIDHEDLDVVQIHTFPFFSMIPRLSTTTVAVDYGVSSTAGLSSWRRANFAYMNWTQHHRYLPNADRVVTLSEFLRQGMPSRLAARAEVIPLGCEHYWREVSAEETLDYRRTKGIPDDAVLALYVGRLNHDWQPYKGVAELLSHFRALAAEGLPVALLCIGLGTFEDERTILRTGAKVVLSAKADEMALAYTAADLFVTCTHWEGFGLPLLEAHRFGRPSVAYALGAHPEIAIAGETAVLVDGEERFRAEWRSLVLDRQRRQRMGAAALEHSDRFSWERTVDAHERVLQSVVQHPATVGASARI